MRIKFFTPYYCNGCHKLYCITRDMEEKIIRLDKPKKFYSRKCLECQTIESKFNTQLNFYENHAIQEAYRIIRKNEEMKKK